MQELTILFFIFECCDIALNRSVKFKDLVYGYAIRWAKNPVFFLLTQFNFLFLSFCIFALEIKSYLLFILYSLYFFDSAYKIYLSHKIINNQLNDDLRLMLDSGYEIQIWQRILFSLTMSFIFYIAFF